MALLNRGKKNKAAVPAEIQEYYETGKRDRTGIAWLLAFGTLVLTIVLAAGIFFAGRWAYRKIAGNDNKTSQVAQNDTQSQDEQTANTPGSSSNEQKAEEKEKQQAEAEQKAEEERKAEAEQKAAADRKAAEERERAADQEAKAQLSSPAPAQQPAGGSGDDRRIAAAGDTIPETGPGDTLAIFFAVSVLGYMLHRVYTNKVTR